MPHTREDGTLSLTFSSEKNSGNSGPAGVLRMAGHNALSLPSLSPAHLPGSAAAARLLSELPAPLGSTGAWPEGLPAPPPVAAPVSAFLGATQGEVKRQNGAFLPLQSHLSLTAALPHSSLAWDEERIPHLPVPLVPQTAKQTWNSTQAGSVA